ncbi:probable F-box protein At2g36090 [Musa acuminata AAA Group]|uniref:probable F-box protein At2g36090 n=1 Tax=Musa acuminata AAA Group TaxID=214697 RepID=UPI0031D16F81
MATQSQAARGTTATATTIEDLHSDMLIRALRHLDGPALAAASCATTHLRAIASQPDLWRDLCVTTWPSLRHPRLLRLLSSSPNAHRSFFSDAFPSPSPLTVLTDDDASLPSELISAVDLYHQGALVLSRVVETDTSTLWFRGAPFRIDALDRKDPPPPPSPTLPAAAAAAAAEPDISPEDLTLSWVVIDPHRRRAMIATSRHPAAVDRHWITGETVVRFASVLGEECALGVVVTCGEETGHVLEMSLMAEGIDGVCLNGRDGLAVIQAAIEGDRKREEAEEVEKRKWEEFVGRRQRRKEAAARRERVVDLACLAVGGAAFLALFAIAVSRWLDRAV